MPDGSAVAQVVLGFALFQFGRALATGTASFGLELGGSALALVGVAVGVYGLFAGVEAAVSPPAEQGSENTFDE